jgi:outer membrane protein OmpA-like peptidoglycan-associated protein
MKRLLILSQFLLIISCSVAQMRYSVTNKKAISLFEEALKAPDIHKNPQTFQPNYAKGIELLQKAIEKEANFWEAYLLMGEFYDYNGQTEEAVKAYMTAIQINPNHSSTFSTYYQLGLMQKKIGDFENAKKNFDFYVAQRNTNENMVNQAYMESAKCAFALESMKNPTDFKPINIGPGINTEFMEYFPTITVDGKTILFTRRIRDERVPFNHKLQEDFFISQLSDRGAWTTGVPMPPNINTVLNEGAPTLAPDGRSLIFVVCSNASNDADYGPNRTGYGSCDLFYTKKLGKQWTDPINLPGNVNTFTFESQPSLSSDGKTLYFIRRVNRRGEPTNSDIFVSKLGTDGKWGTAERLPNYINTPDIEESVLIHPDGKTLYFASKGHIGLGGSDIFMCRMQADGTWGKPENLGYPINSPADENSLMVSPDGEIGFFASNREGGYGDLDIYYFEMPEKFKPTKTLYFEGNVFDALTRKPIPGKFQLIELKSGKEVIVAEADPVSGEFMVSLPVDNEYVLNVSYPNYNFYSKNFNMNNPDNREAIHMDVPMVPLDSEIPTVLENVFFDLGKATLRPESYVELNKLKDFLILNASVKIEIGGHTDTRGDADNNQILSMNRAKSVYEYLISVGIAANRLSYKGYGETKTVVSDEEISKLASDKEKEAAHQKNRRTEYKIIK